MFKLNFLSKKKLIFLVLLILIPFVLMEIWVANRLATFGGEISKLNTIKENLLLEQEVLKNQLSQSASLKQIEEKALELGFEKIKKIEYLKGN